MKVMRIAGVATLLAIAAMILLLKGRKPGLAEVKSGGAS
jgi:hypothetical protein